MNVCSFILCPQTVRNVRYAREAQASMKFTKRFRLNLKPQTFLREDSGCLFAVSVLLQPLSSSTHGGGGGWFVADYSLLLFGQMICSIVSEVLICYQYVTAAY